jgi:hypothetical protein
MRNKVEQLAALKAVQENLLRGFRREDLMAELGIVLRNFLNPSVLLKALGGAALAALPACAAENSPPPTELEPLPTKSAPMNPTDIPTLENTPAIGLIELTSTPAPTETAAHVVEPTMEAKSQAESAEYQPPNFGNKDGHLQTPPDVTTGFAIYALTRTFPKDDVKGYGPRGFDPNTFETEFPLAMMKALENYQKDHPEEDVEILQDALPGKSVALLTRHGRTQALLGFKNGVLANSDPGHWDPDAEQIWVDFGGPINVFIQPDERGYIVKVDEAGNVVAFLNTNGATKDNVTKPDQWIKVVNGLPTKRWNKDLGQYENVYYRWDDPELLAKVTTEFEQKFGMTWDQFFTKMVEQKYISTGASYGSSIDRWGYYLGNFNGIVIGRETITNPTDHSQALVVFLATQGADLEPKLLPYTIAIDDASGFGHTTINTFIEGGDFVQNKNPLLPTSLSQLKSDISQYQGHRIEFDVIIRFGSPDQCNQSKSPRYLNTTSSTFWQYLERVCKLEETYLNALSLEPLKNRPEGIGPKLLPSMEVMMTKGDSSQGIIVDWFGIHIIPPQQ